MDILQCLVLQHLRTVFVLRTLFTAEQYSAKLSQQEEDIGNLRNLIEETAARAEECQAELEESKATTNSLTFFFLEYITWSCKIFET